MWQLETLPNTQEVVVDVAENVCLSASISTETLKLIWANSERGNDIDVTPLGPVVGRPPQEREDPLHLFPKKQDFLLPAGLVCASF